MLITIALLILGLFLLVKGADFFVDSSIGIASALRISPLIIGATIVSVATTSPEVMVSSLAAWHGETGLAIGNAIGSCIVNIGLIVGLVCLLKRPILFSSKTIIFSSRCLLAAAILIFALTLGLRIHRILGPILIIFAIIFLFLNMRQRKELYKGDDSLVSTKKESLLRHIGIFIGGAILVIVGSRLLVSSAVSIAKILGISPTVIGLTVASIGTSLPELTTALTSVKKNRTELFLGNILGANVLNLTLVIGAAASMRTLNLSRFTQIYSIPVMLLLSGLLVFYIRRRGQLTRKEGEIIFSLYCLYIFGLILATLVGIR